MHFRIFITKIYFGCEWNIISCFSVSGGEEDTTNEGRGKVGLSTANHLYINPVGLSTANHLYINPECLSTANNLYINPVCLSTANHLYFNPVCLSTASNLYINPVLLIQIQLRLFRVPVPLTNYFLIANLEIVKIPYTKSKRRIHQLSAIFYFTLERCWYWTT